MVDPNPARGMPLQLQRYWLAGKGAAKIRWGLPHDFNRCVRNLRKYFPKNPEGLCNILHTKALGHPPGKGHGHSLTASIGTTDGYEGLVAAQALLDRQPTLGTYLWAGPIAPIGRVTEEPNRRRVFEPGALRHRPLPLPFDWREHQAPRHDGAVTVGRILGIAYGPNEAGLDYAWAWGDYLDEEIIPDAKKAKYLMDQGVLGASVDGGGQVIVTMDPMTGTEHASVFTIGGVTAVPIAAFSGMQLFSLDDNGDWPDYDMDMVMDLIDEEEDCSCGGALTAAVNPNGWKGLPLAQRNSVFDNDDAVKRITAWAGGGQDTEKMRQAFMYFNPQGNPGDPTSYRLPVGDIINGRLTLIFHAIYAAAALLSGAHGGLPNIPEQDKGELRNVISEVYEVMAEEFGDQSIRAPWDRSAQPGVQMSVTYAATEPYGDVEYADPGYRDNKKRYPIDTPDHIRAAWSYINQEKNANFYDAKQLAAIKAKIKAAAKRHGVEISDESMTASTGPAGVPLTPPSSWFQNPNLSGKTPLTVTPEGRVFGHLAAWGECHRDMAMRECVMAPKSRANYAPFHLGTVVTEEGETLGVGKIVMDTNHADVRLGYVAAAGHYDHTGTEVAIVRAGEDAHGIWVAGSLIPEATPHMAAKLRRSPLSGDWRRQNGNLELTAALAVNAPAFPVYSMEAEGQWSLVAAGSLLPYYEESTMTYPSNSTNAPLEMTSIDPEALVAAVDDAMHQFSQDDLAQRFSDLREDDDIYDERDRRARFNALLAGASASKDPWSKPVKQPAPAAAPAAGAATPGAAPVPGAPAVNPDEAELIAMNADAQYTVTRDSAEAEDADQFDEADAAVDQRQTAAPIQQAPQAPQQPVPVQ